MNPPPVLDQPTITHPESPNATTSPPSTTNNPRICLPPRRKMRNAEPSIITPNMLTKLLAATALLSAVTLAPPPSAPTMAPPRPSITTPTNTSTPTSSSTRPRAPPDGFHQYDQQLEDYSAKAVAAQVAFLHDYDKKLSAIDPKALDPDDAADLQVLINNIKSQLALARNHPQLAEEP